MARPRKDRQIDIALRALIEAEKLIASRNNVDFSMAELAAAIGCKAPALYNHFASKGELLRQVRIAEFQRFLHEHLMPAGARAKTSMAKLEQGALAYVQFGRENPALYRLMFAPASEWLGGDASQACAAPQMTDYPSFAFLAETMAALQKEGQLPRGNATQQALLMWAGLHGLVDLATQADGPMAAFAGQSQLLVRQFIRLMSKKVSS